MKRKRPICLTKSDITFEIVKDVVIFVVLLLVLYPLYFMVIASISDSRLVSSGKVFLWPKGITLEGYRTIIDDQRIWRGYGNTIFYSVVGTLINLIVTIPAAYTLSRKDFVPRKAAIAFFMIPMFISGGLIPTYIVVKSLGLLDTVWIMLLLYCLNVYNLIIARSFFESSLPPDLLEAARIDGCSNIRFFMVIALPLSKAIIAVIGLYYFVGHWNEYFNALIYLNNDKLVPLQLVLRDILISNQAFSSGVSGGDAAQQKADLIKYCVIIVSTAPLLIIYPFLQKFFNKGVMIGSIKG